MTVIQGDNNEGDLYHHSPLLPAVCPGHPGHPGYHPGYHPGLLPCTYTSQWEAASHFQVIRYLRTENRIEASWGLNKSCSFNDIGNRMY